MWPALIAIGVVAYLVSRPRATPVADLSVSGEWVHPVPGACLTSPFGERSSGMHYGVDYGVVVGTPVYAPHSGTVYAAGDVGGGCGVFLGIAWDGGSGTRGPHIELCHLSEVLVKAGDVVKAGQMVARSGNTGGVAAHLHIEYRDKVLDTYVNPPWEEENPSPSCYT